MAKNMTKKSPDPSLGPMVVLLIIFGGLAILFAALLFGRIWMATTSGVSNANVNTNITQSTEVTVNSPAQGSQVSSPISITGSAPGTWYFEASFPVRLEDEQGVILAQSYAQAVGEWMTEEQVQFTSTLEYSVSEETNGTLIFQPDDPAGFGVTQEYRRAVLLLP